MTSYESIEIGKMYWTMRGSRPAHLKAITKHANKHMGGWFCYSIYLWDESKNMTYSRRPEQLFEKYEDLKNYVFPNLE